MGNDRLHDVGTGEVGFLQLQRLELGLTVANQLLGIAADLIEKLLDLGFARWLLEILENLRFHALALQQVERLT